MERGHAELHAGLARIIAGGGKTGEAAQAVAKALHPHFAKEEEYALPPLGLLVPLAEGRDVTAARDVIAMTDRLKAELPRMLEEHRRIARALEDMSAQAAEERKSEAARFADALIQHARTKEEILYPAAILVGEFLKRRHER